MVTPPATQTWTDGHETAKSSRIDLTAEVRTRFCFAHFVPSVVAMTSGPLESLPTASQRVTDVHATSSTWPVPAGRRSTTHFAPPSVVRTMIAPVFVLLKPTATQTVTDGHATPERLDAAGIDVRRQIRPPSVVRMLVPDPVVGLVITVPTASQTEAVAHPMSP